MDSELEEASPEAGTSRTGVLDFSAYSSTEPHLITLAEMNDLVLDLDLAKTKAELTGSQLQQWNLLEKGVELSFHRNRQLNIAKYFSTDGDKVYCNDVCGLTEELQLQHAPEQWRLFNHSSVVSLKAVLLHNGNRHSSLPLHMKETHANIQGLLKRYIMKTTSGTSVLT